ncbi:hypothetical protein [Pseudonocardia sp. MH-G8]|uniref:hypothetical protein n=1 Tax=Pseudonocardia sp. MH-G8 TaxID=1854588 RepID=UPI000B9FEFFA|nr:hypothetical protein [Pseudonocardia sp. MH-G8]OZM76380.1 hypothetical protein CFP66_41320 [Pseudonocardia sp. MH-G8]
MWRVLLGCRVGKYGLFTVKQNQPRLFAALDAQPWAQTPVAACEVDRAHGRVTTRTVQVLPAPADLPFPHVSQLWLIERYVTDLDGTPLSAVAALGVTILPAQHATPQCLASLVRSHWGIESLHGLRDTVYREDDSTLAPTITDDSPRSPHLWVGLQRTPGQNRQQGLSLATGDLFREVVEMESTARRVTRRVARVVLIVSAVVLISAGSCGRTDGGGSGPQNPPPGQPAPTDTDDREDPGRGPATDDGSRDQDG